MVMLQPFERDLTWAYKGHITKLKLTSSAATYIKKTTMLRYFKLG